MTPTDYTNEAEGRQAAAGKHAPEDPFLGMPARWSACSRRSGGQRLPERNSGERREVAMIFRTKNKAAGIKPPGGWPETPPAWPVHQDVVYQDGRLTVIRPTVRNRDSRDYDYTVEPAPGVQLRLLGCTE